MARYTTTIDSSLPPADAFAYMADFSNTRDWDPSVTRADRPADGPIGVGSRFDLVTRFGGRDVPLTYVVVAYEPPAKVVLEAVAAGFTSRDTISVEPAGDGSRVTYDAVLTFRGPRRILEPVMQLLFKRVGDRARDGMRAALNPSSRGQRM